MQSTCDGRSGTVTTISSQNILHDCTSPHQIHCSTAMYFGGHGCFEDARTSCCAGLSLLHHQASRLTAGKVLNRYRLIEVCQGQESRGEERGEGGSDASMVSKGLQTTRAPCSRPSCIAVAVYPPCQRRVSGRHRQMHACGLGVPD